MSQRLEPPRSVLLARPIRKRDRPGRGRAPAAVGRHRTQHVRAGRHARPRMRPLKRSRLSPAGRARRSARQWPVGRGPWPAPARRRRPLAARPLRPGAVGEGSCPVGFGAGPRPDHLEAHQRRPWEPEAECRAGAAAADYRRPRGRWQEGGRGQLQAGELRGLSSRRGAGMAPGAALGQVRRGPALALARAPAWPGGRASGTPGPPPVARAAVISMSSIPIHSSWPRALVVITRTCTSACPSAIRGQRRAHACDLGRLTGTARGVGDVAAGRRRELPAAPRAIAAPPAPRRRSPWRRCPAG